MSLWKYMRHEYQYPLTILKNFTVFKFHCTVCQNIIKLSSKNCIGVSAWH